MQARRLLSLSAAFVLSATLSACDDLCENDVRSEVTTADGKWIAKSYVRGCGATTRDLSYVSVHLKLAGKSNAVGDDRDIVLALDRTFALSLNWAGPRSLLIRCPTCARENVRYLSAVSEYGEVDIKFEGAVTPAVALPSAEQKAGKQQDHVPDAKTAVRIAEAVLSARFGEARVKAESPFEAFDHYGDMWMVGGTLPGPSVPRGGMAVIINKRDGRILNVLERTK